MNFRKNRAPRNSTNLVSSSEKWRNFSKRISRRNIEYDDEDSDENNDPKIDELKNWVEEFFVRKSSGVTKTDQDSEVFLTRKQTLILSTLVPDEILLMDGYDTAHPRRFVGVLLMADVSGYTALSERYNNLGKTGTYRLTVTLNTYLGSLIEVIYSHGGDIIKFAGDAFLALWKTDKRTFICHTIHTAIACALIIQHSYGSYETDVKVNLKVKLGIAAGNIIFAPIGTGIDMNYIIIGLPVFEAKMAESVCDSGEVILTPTAWGHCYSRNYDYVIHENGFVTIKTILYDPREKDVNKPFPGFGAMVRQIKKPGVLGKNLPDNLTDSDSITDILLRNETLSMRKAILVAEEKNIGSEIRKFMIRPVLTQIDAHQPLEYLTEMRQVTILFITLKPRECTYPQLITIVNNAYQITCDIVYKSMGCVNKIILFDKDVMILVIFGLRGFKHESEAQAALKCSYSIKKSVSALDGVLEVSIGITTGQVYCGVIGHPLRREFTVIGAIVNKAARFMCGFRNKITCDEATFVKSKMSSNGFTLQPTITLKGIPQPGKIYEYTEDIRVKELYGIPIIPPLLDRKEEMEYLQDWLDKSTPSKREFDALLYVGEPRIGKTRLLEWMAQFVRNKEIRVCYVSLTSIHSATPYLALSQITNQILNLNEPIIGFSKEEKIIQLLKSYNDNLCYLNNIIKVRFAYHESINLQDEEVRKKRAEHMFKKLMMAISEKYVVFLDDLQNLDGFSWDFISIMFNSLNIFVVLTVSRGKFTSVSNWLYNVFTDNKIRKVVLGPLTSSWIAPLACQILDIDAVPNDLCNTLRIKCNGMPGLIESFIVHMFSIGAIQVQKILDNELSNWESEDLQFPESNLLRPIAINAKDQPNLDKLMEDNITSEIGICVVTNNQELNIDINLQSLDTLIMIQIDSLTPYQQLLLKIASVIGNVLSRDLLESIMYENNPITTAKAIKRLFSMRILTCANAKSNFLKKRETSTVTMSSHSSTQIDITCECCFEYDPDNFYGLPKYSFCKVIKFKNSHSRQTCYELLPINQKREFHTRIVQYLENNKQKCTQCGGTIIITQSSMSLQPDIPFAQKYDFLEAYDESDQNESDDEFEMDTSDIAQNTPFYKEPISMKRTQSENLSNDDLTKATSEKLSFLDVASWYSLTNTPELSKANISYVPILKNSIDCDFNPRQKVTKRVTISSFHKQDISDIFDNYKIYDMFRLIMEADSISDWHKIGVIDSTDNMMKEGKEKGPKESFNITIEKGVSEIDFQRCTCAELNIVIHEQLIQHAKEAELKCKAVEFMIKYALLSILVNDFENILPKLEEAQSICMNELAHINKVDRKMYLGRIYSLKASTNLMCDKLSDAKREIDRALSIYRIEFDNVKDFFKFTNLKSRLSIQRKKYLRYNQTMKSDSVFCLNIAALVYSALGEEGKSRSAILRALHLVQRVECNIIDVCEAFTNAIQMEVNRNSSASTEEIERIASTTIKKLNIVVQSDELFAFGKLFLATFRARMARGNLPATIRSGYRALAISRLLAGNISMEIIPDFFYILISRRRLEEAIDVLKLSVHLSQAETSSECQTWYYALCMDLILDAGLQLETPHDISRFAVYALHRGKSAGPSRRRLATSLWTYWLRADSDRKAKRFENEALRWSNLEEDERDGTLTTLLSSLRLAEGMLESLARKVDDLKKVVDLMELRSLAAKELTKLEKGAHALRAIYPRWLLLKAYSQELSGRHMYATNTLNQAMDEARKIKNRLEEAHVLAATSNSKTWVQSAKTGYFMNWCAGIDQVRTSWHQLLYKMTASRQH